VTAARDALIGSRGFLLGTATAVSLAVGFVAVRKAAGLFPGPKVTVQAAEDYRALSHRMRMQAVLDRRDRVLLVDDRAERGSQADADREKGHVPGRCHRARGPEE
jgi:adenine phosphoribosyltransferase